MNKIFLLGVLFFTPSIIIEAQSESSFSTGIHLGYDYFFGTRASPSIGLQAVFPGAMESVMAQYSITYHRPVLIHGSDFVEPYGSSTLPRLPLKYTDKLTVFDLDCCARIYVGDNSYDDGGIYPLIGVAIGYARSSITYDTFDPDNYRLSDFFTGHKDAVYQMGLSFGLGYDYMLDNIGVVAAQLYSNLSLRQYNSTEGSQYIPGFVGIKLLFSLR